MPNHTNVPATAARVFVSRTLPLIDAGGRSRSVYDVAPLFETMAAPSEVVARNQLHPVGACAIVNDPSSAVSADNQLPMAICAFGTGVRPSCATTRPRTMTPRVSFTSFVDELNEVEVGA